MTFKKCLCFVILLGTLTATPVFPQERKTTRKIPKTTGQDPFELTTGSSFSASGSSRRSNPKTSSGLSTEKILSDFQSALEIIRDNYADGAKLDTGVLTSTAISSMLKMLDPHSNYYDATEFLDLLGEHESEYSGTGSSIAGYFRNGTIETYIVSTFPDSPAARAKLRFGDRIVAVNGRSVSGQAPGAVRDKVRGKRGTFVRLTIERSDSKAFEVIEMQRDRVHEPAVPGGYLVKPGIGYIDLTAGFSYATLAELETALKDLHRQGMTSLILDIRGNGGGILNQAVKVAEKFLPAGSKIVSQRGRYPDDTRTWTASKPRYETMPLVLLVDENSASASEVLAGAFQDNDRALIVGEKTFGKGLVQSVLTLPYGSGLTLTAARYYTPSGRSIQRDYSDVGLYDYFNHRNISARIERSAYVARTITNRVVYGGDGIAPDEIAKERKLTPAQISLLDPLFFFAREAINSGVKDLQTTGVTDRMVDQFAEFVAKEKAWKISPDSINRERPYIRNMLRYNLVMATLGAEGANRTRIENDPEVRLAIDAMPRAARLAVAAQKVRVNALKEKSSSSLVLNEQR